MKLTSQQTVDLKFKTLVFLLSNPVSYAQSNMHSYSGKVDHFSHFGFEIKFKDNKSKIKLFVRDEKDENVYYKIKLSKYLRRNCEFYNKAFQEYFRYLSLFFTFTPMC